MLLSVELGESLTISVDKRRCLCAKAVKSILVSPLQHLLDLGLDCSGPTLLMKVLLPVTVSFVESLDWGRMSWRKEAKFLPSK